MNATIKCSLPVFTLLILQKEYFTKFMICLTFDWVTPFDKHSQWEISTMINQYSLFGIFIWNNNIITLNTEFCVHSCVQDIFSRVHTHFNLAAYSFSIEHRSFRKWENFSQKSIPFWVCVHTFSNWSWSKSNTKTRHEFNYQMF